MFHFITGNIVYIILLVDIIILLLLLHSFRVLKAEQFYLYIIIFILFTPSIAYKYVIIGSSLSASESYESHIKVNNNLDTWSPIYVIDSQRNILLVSIPMFTSKFEKNVLHRLPEETGLITASIEGKYFVTEFRFQTYTEIELNKAVMKPDNDNLVQNILSENRYSLWANYSSQLLTLIVIPLIIFKLASSISSIFKPFKFKS